MTTTTIPTLTVRLDEVEGLTGWTARLAPGTPERPDPILTVADAEGVVQAARRIHGLADAELEPLIEEDGATGVLVDLLVPIGALDPALMEGAGIGAAALPERTARRLAQRALEMREVRMIDAEEESAVRPPAPAPAGQSDAADAEWDF